MEREAEKKKTLKLLVGLTERQNEKKKHVMFEEEKPPNKKMRIAEEETPIGPDKDGSVTEDEEEKDENEAEQNDEGGFLFIL